MLLHRLPGPAPPPQQSESSRGADVFPCAPRLRSTVLAPPRPFLRESHDCVQRGCDGRFQEDIVLAVAVVVGTVMAAVWALWLTGVLSNSGQSDPSGGILGADFAMFQTAAGLILEGRAADLYDAAAYQTAVTQLTGTNVLGTEVAYLLPPYAALVFVPFVVFAHPAGWFVWVALGVLILMVGFRLLGVDRSLEATVIALLFAPVFVNLRLGQAALVAFILYAASYALLGKNRALAAGLVAGALVYKPQLAVGLVLWWLIDRRYWKALGGTAITAGVLVLGSLLAWPQAWSAYPAALRRSWALFDQVGFLRFAYTPHRTFSLLFPGGGAWVLVLSLASAVAGIAAFGWFYRKHRGEWRLLFAASVVLAVWLTPHLLMYDWVLLLIPAAILWTERPHRRELWLVLGAVLAMGALLSGLLIDEQLEAWGRALQIAVPVLAVVALMAARAVGKQRSAVGEQPQAIGVRRY